MVNPVLRRNGGPPIGLNVPAIMTASDPPFPSSSAPPNWYTLPNFNAPIMDPSTGTIGIPWNNFLTFTAARASTITGLTNDVTTLQHQVSTIQGQIATIQGQITSLQSQVNDNTANIATLQGQVSTLQGQVSTIQSQITALQATDTSLQNQINVIDNIFAVTTVASLPTPAGNQGRRTFVSDSSVTAFGTIVAGGGTTFVPVYCDNTNWLVG